MKKSWFCLEKSIALVLELCLCLFGYHVIVNDRLGEYREKNMEVKETTAQTDVPKVALTFDDGPSIYTEKLSQGLKERGVKATFFLLGQNIEGHTDSVHTLWEDGHILGNHSYHHIDLAKLNEKEACQEIQKTNNMIFELTGEYPLYVRPPYGEWNANLDYGVEMIPVFWSIDSLDWKLQEKNKIANLVLNQVGDNDIILMHDGFESSVEAAFIIVDTLLDKGYEFVSVEELLLD